MTFQEVVCELQAGGKFEDVKDIATKATSLAARYALIFALLDLAALGDLSENIPPFPESSGYEHKHCKAISYLKQ